MQLLAGARQRRIKRRWTCRTTFLAAIVLAVAVLGRQPAVAAAGAVATAERKEDVVLAAATLAAFQEVKACSVVFIEIFEICTQSGAMERGSG